MKRLLLGFVTLAFFVVTSAAAAAPGAKDLLQRYHEQIYSKNIKTQHVVYRTTSVVWQTGQQAVTQVQTMEMWKDSAKRVKVVMDDGLSRQEVISEGNYFYLKNEGTGKWNVFRTGYAVDPFQGVPVDLKVLEGAGVKEEGEEWKLEVQGGEWSGKAVRLVGRMGKDGLMKEMTGYGKNGEEVLRVKLEHENVGGVWQVKRMEMEGKIHGNRTKVEMEVLKNEVNVALPEGVFEVK